MAVSPSLWRRFTHRAAPPLTGDEARAGRRATPPTVHLAASLGGHLELLVALGDSLARYQRVWVTAAGRGADPLRAAGEDVRDLPRFSRARPTTALRNVVRSLGTVLKERPTTVVATGAGSVVAFCVFARLLGARVIFVETMARVTSASASGRILSRIASRVVVQWAEMQHVYPGATLCRPVLFGSAASAKGMRGRHRAPSLRRERAAFFERRSRDADSREPLLSAVSFAAPQRDALVAAEGVETGTHAAGLEHGLSGVEGRRAAAASGPEEDAAHPGTLVAVGTHRHPFDRLLAMVDRASEAGVLPQPITAQTGTSSYRPENFRADPFIPPERLEWAMELSTLVVCHAGAAVIADAVRNGHKPLVLARQASLEEHVDDHQAQLTEKLAGLGLIVALNGEIGRAEVASALAGRFSQHPPLDGAPVDEVLAEELPPALSKRPLAR